MNNEDKQAWCDHGEKEEKKFLEEKKVSGWDISLNPQKAHNKYAHDFVSVCPVDLKTMTTPFRLSEDLYGIPSSRAVTINKKDFERYAKLYPNIIILCNVVHANKMFTITVSRARKLISEKKARLHKYKNRKNDDKGNARCSYVFDTNDLDEVYG